MLKLSMNTALSIINEGKKLSQEKATAVIRVMIAFIERATVELGHNGPRINGIFDITEKICRSPANLI